MSSAFVASLKDLSMATQQDIEGFCKSHPDPFIGTPQNITDLYLSLFGAINRKRFLNSTASKLAESHFSYYEERFKLFSRHFASETIEFGITTEVVRYLFFMSLPLFHVPLSRLVLHPNLCSQVLVLENQMLEGMELIFTLTSESEVGFLSSQEQSLLSIVVRKRKAYTSNGVRLSQEDALMLWSIESPVNAEFYTRLTNALHFKNHIQKHPSLSIPLSPHVESPRRASDPILTPQKKVQRPPTSWTPPASLRGKEEHILILSSSPGKRAPLPVEEAQNSIYVEEVATKKTVKPYQQFLIEKTLHSFQQEYQITLPKAIEITLKDVFYDETLRSWIVDFLEDIHNEFSHPKRKCLYKHCQYLLNQFTHFLIGKTFSFYWLTLKDNPEGLKSIKDPLLAFFKDPDCQKRAEVYLQSFTKLYRENPKQAEATLHPSWVFRQDNPSPAINDVYFWLQGITTFLLYRQKIQRAYPCRIDYGLIMDWIGQTSLEEQAHLRTSLEYDKRSPSAQNYQEPEFWTFFSNLSIQSLRPFESLSLLLRLYQIDYPPPLPEEKPQEGPSLFSSVASLFSRGTPVLDMERLPVEEISVKMDRESLFQTLRYCEKLGSFKIPSKVLYELFYENIQTLQKFLWFLSRRFEVENETIYGALHAGMIAHQWHTQMNIHPDVEIVQNIYQLLFSCSLSNQRAVSTLLQSKFFTQIPEKKKYIGWCLKLLLQPFHRLQLVAAIYQENMAVTERLERHQSQLEMIGRFEREIGLPLSSQAHYALLSTNNILQHTVQLFSQVGTYLQKLDSHQDFGPSLKDFVASPLYPTHAPFLEFIQSLFPFDDGLNIVFHDDFQRITPDKQGWGLWQSGPQETLFTGYYFISTRTDVLYTIHATLPFNWPELSIRYPRLKNFLAQLFKEPLLKPLSNWGELSETARNIVREFNPPGLEKNILLNQLTHFALSLRWQYRKLFVSHPIQRISEKDYPIELLFGYFQKNENIKVIFPWPELPQELHITLTSHVSSTICTVAFKSFSHSVELSKTSSPHDFFIALLPPLHKSQAMAKALISDKKN